MPSPTLGLYHQALWNRLCISAVSGDRLLKRYVVAMPDLQEQQLSSQDDALILASDGLWDVLTNQDAAQCIKDIKVILINLLQAMHNAVNRWRELFMIIPSQHLQNQPWKEEAQSWSVCSHMQAHCSTKRCLCLALPV